MKKALAYNNLWFAYAALLVAIDVYAWSTGIARFYSLQTVWTVIGLVALGGYIFQRAIAYQVIWKIVFLLQVVGILVFAAMIQKFYSVNGAGDKSLFYVFIFVFQIPYWYALWAYAFKSGHLWADKN